MNVSVLMGRLTREPNITYGAEDMAIARYTLAVDRMGGKETDFISCVAFGKNAEFAQKWLHKGTKVVVNGRIQTGSYTNRDGQKVYTTDVVVERAEFAESKAAAGGAPSAPQGETAVKTPTPGTVNTPWGEVAEVADEGLPWN